MKKFLTYASVAVMVMAAGITDVSATKLSQEQVEQVETKYKQDILTKITIRESDEKTYLDNVDTSIKALCGWFPFCMEKYTTNNEFEKKQNNIANFYEEMKENIKTAKLEKNILEKLEECILTKIEIWFPYVLIRGLTDCKAEKTNWKITEQSIKDWGKKQTEIFKKFFKDLKEKSEQKDIQKKPTSPEVHGNIIIPPAELYNIINSSQYGMLNKTEIKSQTSTNHNVVEDKKTEEKKNPEEENTDEEFNIVEEGIGFNPDTNNDENKNVEQVKQKKTAIVTQNVPVIDPLKTSRVQIKKEKKKVVKQGTKKQTITTTTTKNSTKKPKFITEQDVYDLDTLWEEIKPKSRMLSWVINRTRNPFTTRLRAQNFFDFVEKLHATKRLMHTTLNYQYPNLKSKNKKKKEAAGKMFVNNAKNSTEKACISCSNLIAVISSQLPNMLAQWMEREESAIDMNTDCSEWKKLDEIPKRQAIEIIKILTVQETSDGKNDAIFRLNKEDENESYFKIITGMKKKLGMQ
jgi:hypothetical protein